MPAGTYTGLGLGLTTLHTCFACICIFHASVPDVLLAFKTIPISGYCTCYQHGPGSRQLEC